jgi:hypothetical protein
MQRPMLAVSLTGYLVGGGHTEQSTISFHRDLLNPHEFFPGHFCLEVVDPVEVWGPGAGLDCCATDNW